MKNNKKTAAERFVLNMFSEFPKALEYAEKFRSDREMFRDMWPEWCDFPMAASYAIITEGMEDDIAKSIIAYSGDHVLPNLTAAIIWNRTKQIYQFDPDLAAALREQGGEDLPPLFALTHLPVPCPFIEIQMLNQESVGFFAWMEYDIRNKAPELRILWLLKNGQTVSMPVILQGKTVDDAMEALLSSESSLLKSDALLREINKDLKKNFKRNTPSVSNEDIIEAINLLLYLCIDELDIDALVVHKRYDVHGNVVRSSAAKVGTRIGSAIRRFKERRGSDETKDKEKTMSTRNSEEGRSAPIPHIRRAHWHHFWTGPRDGERNLVLRWLPPITVGDEDVAPVVRKVKE